MRKMKNCIALIMVIVLAAFQPITAYADSNVFLTVQQVSNLMDGMESITTQLQDLGLDIVDIKELFEITPREVSFYSSNYPVIPYSGTFIAKSQNAMPNTMGIYNYDGNPPASVDIQKERIKSIFTAATRYYRTDYYEGPKGNATEFGKYLTYLYLSHYIDGPGRAPNANDLPYIVSASDISAYHTFLNTSQLSSVLSGVASFGSAMYGTIDYAGTINSVNTIDQMINRATMDAAAAAINGYNIAGATLIITPLIKSRIAERYTTAASEEELTRETLNYMESQLTALNFYETYDKNITESMIGIFTSLFIGIISSSLSLMGVIIAAVPFFTYSFTGLVQTAVLVNLGYSFSGRQAIRTGIYLGM